MPVASAAAEPPLDPPGVRAGFHGLRGSEDSVDRVRADGELRGVGLADLRPDTRLASRDIAMLQARSGTTRRPENTEVHMRWATFQLPGADTERIGLVRGDTIHAMAPGTKLIDLLGDDGERLARAGERVTTDPASVIAVDQVRLLPPIPRPPAVRDFMTFQQHIEVIRKARGLEVPRQFFEFPVFYFTNPRALVGAHDPVPVPPGCQWLDFECEIAAVISREGKNLNPEAAWDHIAGFCLFNDWSARDVQFYEMEMQLGPAKGKDTATTLGPWLVTKDEIASYRKGTGYDLTMVVSVNGKEYGRDQWCNAYWSFGEIIAYASRGTWVSTGDVLGSGTCGRGCLAELRTYDAAAYPWLKIGDEVVYEVERLGRIANRVVAGPPLIPLRP
jgi:2-keto-4-pentenoate hydratase/2-oxohepta-3-ene-1,7-dioic acid hydratase in catechol pathway